MSHSGDRLTENNAKVAALMWRQAESGIFVAMHHNDNCSPRTRSSRRLLTRAGVGAALIAMTTLTIAWVGVLLHVFYTLAISVPPFFCALASTMIHLVQWI